MKRWFLAVLALLLCLSVTAEVFAFDSDIYNTKRGVRKVLSGGGKMKAYSRTYKSGLTVSAPAIKSLIRSGTGPWGIRPTKDGTYDFRVEDGMGKTLSTGKYTRDIMQGYGTFHGVASDDGNYKLAKVKLTDTAKRKIAEWNQYSGSPGSAEHAAGMAAEKVWLEQLNQKIAAYGYTASLKKKTTALPDTWNATGRYRLDRAQIVLTPAGSAAQ